MCNFSGDGSGNIEGTKYIYSECVVKFRPNDDWEGEYGFDWYRTGDCNEKGMTVDYDNDRIVGKYYVKNKDGEYKDFIDGISVDPDHPQLMGSFYTDTIKEKNYWAHKLASEYNGNCVIRDKDNKNQKYYIPFISLYYESDNKFEKFLPTIMISYENGRKYLKNECKTEAIVKVLINAENIDKIVLRYDGKDTSLDIKVIGSSDLAPNVITNIPNGYSERKIKIRYIYDGFKNDYKAIRAIAYWKNTEIKSFAGQVNIIRCIPKLVKVRFVCIKSKFNEGISEISKEKIDKEKKYLKKFLSQAHIITEIETDDFPNNKQEQLDGILNKYKDSSKNCLYLSKDNNLIEELDELYLGKNEKGAIQYGDKYYIYVINEMANKGGEAFTPGQSSVVFYKESDDCTICHELLHNFGLLHSFSNINEYTFEKRRTSNVMDYTNGYTLWKWQWKQINDAI